MKKLLSFLFFVSMSLSAVAQEEGLDQKIDQAFKPVSDFFNTVIFFPVFGTPFVLMLLVGSAFLKQGLQIMVAIGTAARNP